VILLYKNAIHGAIKRHVLLDLRISSSLLLLVDHGMVFVFNLVHITCFA